MFAAWIVGVGAVGVQAAPLPSTIRYTTSGSIGEEGRDGPGAIHFVGKERAAFYDPASGGSLTLPVVGEPEKWYFNLGHFQISPSTTGAATEYHQTPFTIDLRVEGVDPVTLTGTLDGWVDASGRAAFLAEFGPTALMGSGTDAKTVDLPLELRVGDLVNTMTLFPTLLPDWATEASPIDRIALGGTITPSAVPEPATWATWGLVGLVALAVRSRRV
jgi:hypothetical protein